LFSRQHPFSSMAGKIIAKEEACNFVVLQDGSIMEFDDDDHLHVTKSSKNRIVRKTKVTVIEPTHHEACCEPKEKCNTVEFRRCNGNQVKKKNETGLL